MQTFHHNNTNNYFESKLEDFTPQNSAIAAKK
jgi:hypothetical protein